MQAHISTTPLPGRQTTASKRSGRQPRRDQHSGLTPGRTPSPLSTTRTPSTPPTHPTTSKTLPKTTLPKTLPTPSVSSPSPTSDSSDDSYIMPRDNNTKPNEDGSASVVANGKSVPPTLSDGTLSIDNLHELYETSYSWLRKQGDSAETKGGAPIDLHTGWSQNTRFHAWYLANSTRFKVMTLDAFFVEARKRWIGERWDYDHAMKVGTERQPHNLLFREFAESVLAQNRFIESSTYHLSDPILLQRLQLNMNTHLHDILAQNDDKAKDLTDLAHLIATATNDETRTTRFRGGESLTTWLELVNERDEDYHRRKKEFSAMVAEDNRGTKRSGVAAGIHKDPHATTFPANTSGSVAAAPSWKTSGSSNNYPQTTSYSNNYANNAPNSYGQNQNTGWGKQQSQPTWQRTNEGQYNLFAPKMEPEERDMMNFCAGCNRCRNPFQSHRAGEQCCDAALKENYLIRDVNFVKDWLAKYPRGMEMGKGKQTMSPPTFDALYAALQKEAPGLANRLINRNRPVAATHVHTDFVAHVERRESFPPKTVLYSQSSVVGADFSDEEDEDYDSSQGASPPDRNVRQRAELHSEPPQRTNVAAINNRPSRSFNLDPSSPSPAEEWKGITNEDVSNVSNPSSLVAAVVEDVTDAVGDVSISTEPLYWNCMANNESTTPAFYGYFKALIDHGSSVVLIKQEHADALGLKRKQLYNKIALDNAFSEDAHSAPTVLDSYVNLTLRDPDNYWTARTVKAIVSPSLCADIILGMPFLKCNSIVVNVNAPSVVHEPSGFDLLHPEIPDYIERRTTFKEKLTETASSFSEMLDELNDVCALIRKTKEENWSKTKPFNVAAALRSRIEQLAFIDRCEKKAAEVREEYDDCFQPLPPVEEMPEDIVCEIILKDPTVTITSKTYSSPRKYKEAWNTLIQQHMDAGRIRPSSSSSVSPAFLVPKSDPSALPRWVNDYRQLNANIVTDKYPLPRIDDILADAGKGRIFSKLDMTDSFFHTKMKPESVPLTAVSTPLGLFEWTVMPQGMKNSPSVHQRRVNEALRPFLGKFCHIYLDDIIIWSETFEQHQEHVRLIMDALRLHRLYCNPRKSQFFVLELDFLGHHISINGIEADKSKIKTILNWPQPNTPGEVRAFLGLTRYLASFLKNLAEFTRVLSPLTSLHDEEWPGWSKEMNEAFNSIKNLVTSAECLTVIDHDNMGDNKIWVTTDASDWRTGAVLSYGPTWESARPVAYDSMQLKGAQMNYPVHEKELLAIIRALKKFRADLLGCEFVVYTDHRTLENFTTQKTLSRRQARWLEDLAQFDMEICYIKGEDNTVADALSRLPADESKVTDCDEQEVANWSAWLQRGCSAAVTKLSINADKELLDSIKKGYVDDPFCAKFISGHRILPSVREIDGLWYIGSRLLVPRVASIREDLYHCAHDVLIHAGADKAYATLRDSFYWPNMYKDLTKFYIPGCEPCARNKASTTRPAGPAHPLPIPDGRGTSVAMDFIGPLPEENGFNGILTMTDRMGSDIRLVPCRMNWTAEDAAAGFFDNWYCENGLPDEMFLDRDKLWTSAFWRALQRLTGVRLKLSSGYHPETDGASERSNKTVNQSIRFFVDRQQKGWSTMLPRIRFGMMNSKNASTGFTGFELRMGRNPRIIPALSKNDIESEDTNAAKIIEQLRSDTLIAQDALIATKVNQAHHVNQTRNEEPSFDIGDRVWLNTKNRRRQYRKKKKGRVAKFIPRFDGPYAITHCNKELSSYSLDVPGARAGENMFHVSLLKPWTANDDEMFPSRKHQRPGPILTVDGLEEFFIEKIIEDARRGRGWRYLVRWKGYGQEEDSWLPGSELEDCEALDHWLEENPHD